MKRSIVIVAAFAALAIAAIVVGIGRLGGGHPGAPATGSSSADAPPAPIHASGPPPGAARLPEPARDDDPRGALRLEGQVVDEHDHPVAHAQVAIDSNPPRTIETEADGAFGFDGLIARDYRLEASADDGYAGPARLRLGPGTEPVTLRLHRGTTVSVHVVAAGGAPIAGAEVELRSALTWRATTDAAGVATLRGVGAVWAPLVARAPGFAPAAMMSNIGGDPAASQTITLTLVKGAAIAGRVVDDAGHPVANARVVATSASEPFAVADARRDGALSAADGTFTIAAVAPGSWRVTASEGEHAPATTAPMTIEAGRDRGGVELVLAAGGVVTGLVQTAKARPIAGADVSVTVRGHLSWRERRRAFTGADGTFTIAGLPRRAVDVVAWHADGSSAIVSADLTTTREAHVDLTLDITGAIAGTVVDRTGAPIGDAQVVAEPVWSGGVADREAWSVRGVQEAVTDQGGAFRFAGLPDGSYRVRAARPGASEDALALSAGEVARPGGPAVQIVLSGDGRVVGKVAFADGTTPRAFTVAVGATAPHPFAPADGKFALNVAAGQHELALVGPGFTLARVHEVAVAEGKDTDVGTITVTPGRSVSGRVLDDNGAPVAGATVAAGTLLSGGGAELYIEDESIGSKHTTTDADGSFALIGFPPAALTVVAGKDGAGRSASVRLPPGPDSATLDLVLQRTTGLDGKIVRSGAPVADTVVIASPLGALGSNFFVTTGPDGTFAFDALAAGSYIVYPMLGGGGNRPKDLYYRKVEVALGARAHVELDASPGPITVTVGVTSDDGKPVTMAMVFLIQAVVDGATMEELRDPGRLPAIDTDVIPMYLRQAIGGKAEIAGVRPGVHTVCVTPLGGAHDDNPPVKCVPAKLTVSPAHVDVVVPAAWLVPAK